MVELSRRRFLTTTSTAGAGGLMGLLGLDLAPTIADAEQRAHFEQHVAHYRQWYHQHRQGG